MTSIDKSGTYTLGDRTVRRLGYGAMQLAGPGVFGPPKDPDAAPPDGRGGPPASAGRAARPPADSVRAVERSGRMPDRVVLVR